MSDRFLVNAEVRSDKGKGSSRRLRRLADKIPAILYGSKKEAISLTLIRKDLEKSLESEAFYTQILTIDIDGKAEQAILKDLQRHPAKETVMHADFLRVSADVKITVRIPLHFINEDICVGVKMEGGMVSHAINEIEVECLPGNLPEFIEVDLAEIALGQSVHMSEVKLPEGVESTQLSQGANHDQSVASVITPRGVAEEAAVDMVDEEAATDEETASDEGESED
jgi:large subunit ribosomal protein L25